jgi:hypothetical protein
VTNETYRWTGMTSREGLGRKRSWVISFYPRQVHGTEKPQNTSLRATGSPRGILTGYLQNINHSQLSLVVCPTVVPLTNSMAWIYISQNNKMVLHLTVQWHIYCPSICFSSLIDSWSRITAGRATTDLEIATSQTVICFPGVLLRRREVFSGKLRSHFFWNVARASHLPRFGS